MNPLAKAADRCRRILSEQQISLAGPGTILRDIETLIECIGANGLETKSKQGMNPTEQYFALLEAWLFVADAEVLGGATRRNVVQFSDNLCFSSVHG
jgi:hypothetical protein